MEGHRRTLEMMVPRVQQVMRQTKARIYRGDTRSVGKIVSLFEPSAEVIRKGKAAKPTEFGKLVKLQEAENQIVIDYEVYAQRPHDAELLIPAIEIHATKLGRMPHLVAADAGFHSRYNQAAAKAKGVKRVCIPDHGSKSASRKREQKKRWFRNGQLRRTGCEGRISVSKRRHASSVAAIAATTELSSPPERKTPTGTSATSLEVTTSSITAPRSRRGISLCSLSRIR